MSKGLLCSARHKQYLSLKCKKNLNNVKLVSYFQKYKNNFTKLVKLAKTNFYDKKFSSVASNPKFVWKLVNDLTGRTSKNKDSVDSMNINNHIILNIEENTKEVSNQFKKIVLKIYYCPKNRFRIN